MKKILTLAALALLFSLGATPAHAVVNAPVNIAYPIENSINDNLLKVSFSVTCPGGQNDVRWSFDGTTVPVGSSTYYDNFNAQFLHKLPTGWHSFFVVTDCGQERVIFYVN